MLFYFFSKTISVPKLKLGKINKIEEITTARCCCRRRYTTCLALKFPHYFRSFHALSPTTTHTGSFALFAKLCNFFTHKKKQYKIHLNFPFIFSLPTGGRKCGGLKEEVEVTMLTKNKREASTLYGTFVANIRPQKKYKITK